MDKEPITLNGLEKLKNELIFLKEKKSGTRVCITSFTGGLNGSLKLPQSTE